MADGTDDRRQGDGRSGLAVLRRMVESERFTAIITVLIVVNAVILGLETWPAAMRAAGGFLVIADKVILWFFLLEIATKILVFRASFFRSGWNLFDCFVIGVSLLPTAGPLSVLRALRVLRVLRLLSTVKELRRVVEALLSALPGMGAILAVMAIVFYVSAVLSVKLFGATHPEEFGNMGTALITLFQLMTLDGWSGEIVRPVIDEHPYAGLFFFPFIVLTSFAVLNLFIAIIVNSMQALQEEELERAIEASEAVTEREGELVIEEVRKLRADLKEIRSLLDQRA